MTNNENVIKKVDATEKTAIVQDKSKMKYFKFKKYKKIKESIDVKQEEECDFVEDLKESLRYGNIGHGVLLDKKV